MRHTLYTVLLLTTLMLLSGCQAMGNPFAAEEQVNYYGARVPMTWLQAFKTVHCATTLDARNGEPVAETLCFDTQAEVLEALGFEDDALLEDNGIFQGE